ARVLVIDGRRILARERADLAAAEKRTGCHILISFSGSVAVVAVGAVAALAALFAITAATALAAVAAITTIPAVATIPALATLLALLHLDRGAVLVLVDLDGQHAHDVVMQAGQTLHLLHGRGGRVRAQEGVMALAVLVDLVGQGAQTPVFRPDHLAAVI